MKKLYLIIAIILLCLSNAYAKDVLDFTSDTTPTSDDILYVINDPTGSPGDRKVTVGNLPKGMSLLYLSDWPVGVSLTELGYLDGVTSSIQTQLNNKQASDADLTTYAGITPTANAQTLLGETFAQMQGSLSIDNLITISGVAEGSDHLGTFTGSTITDNVTIKAGMQLLETAVETKTTAPANNTANYIPQWNGADSKLLKDGLELSNDTTLGDDSVAAVPTEHAAKTYADGKIPKSTIAAAGDVLVGTGVATPGVITKGANNSLFGVSNAGVLGFFTAIYLDIPWAVGTGECPTTEGQTLWRSDLDSLCIGTGASYVTPLTSAPSGIVIDFGGATSFEIPNAASPTVNVTGKIALDTTSDQIKYYGAAERVLPYKKSYSIVVPAVAATDDMLFVKLPYGITLLSLDCIVSAATSATINIQECTSTGTSCDDMATDDLVCDTDGAVTTTFGGTEGATAASGAWLKLDVASISGTPGTLTVTITYSVIGD